MRTRSEPNLLQGPHHALLEMREDPGSSLQFLVCPLKSLLRLGVTGFCYLGAEGPDVEQDTDLGEVSSGGVERERDRSGRVERGGGKVQRETFS